MYRSLLASHIDLANQKDFHKPLWAFDLETDGKNGPITVAAVSGPGITSFSKSPTALLRGDAQPQLLAVHGGKYDLRKCLQEKHDIPPMMWLDNMAAVWLLSEERKRLGLKVLAPEILGVEPWGHWEPGMSEEELTAYLEKDVTYTRALALWAWPRLEQEGLLRQFLKVEAPMLYLAAEMEQQGIRIDRPLLENLWKHSRVRIEELKIEMKKAWPDFPWDCERCGGTGTYKWKRANKTTTCRECEGSGTNNKVWNSPDQLADLLFNRMELEPLGFTKTGQAKTGEQDLTIIRSRCHDEKVGSFLDMLLAFREEEKLYSSFYTPYLEAGSDRLYPTWKPWGTKTGRWSCKEPNLMQVPERVRRLFLPDEGCAFVCGDYSQLEMYLAGVLSGETAITEAYEQGVDLHSRTAEAAQRDRSVGKTVNFALLYGLSVKSLAGRLNTNRDTALQIRNTVLGDYRALGDWLDSQKRTCREQGFVTTILGRKRRIPEIYSDDGKKRAKAENQAVNTPVQGSAADLMKVAQIRCRLEIPGAIPVLQVHDELVNMVPIEDAEKIREEMKHCMEQALPTLLQPKAEVRIMERWGK